MSRVARPSGLRPATDREYWRNPPMCTTRNVVSVALLALALGCTGCDCACRITKLDPDRKDADLIGTNYRAIDCLLEHMPCKTAPDPNRRMLVATVVNLDDVKDSSTFGRLTGELLAARLAQHGYSVVHMTIRKGSVVIKDEGEFLLSRDIKELATDYNAASVLVSTYTLSPDKVFVSLKLVNAEANTVVAAVDYTIPKGPRTVALLGGGSGGGAKPADPFAGYYRVPR